MIEVSATKLRANLFEYLDKIENGETVVVQRHNRKVVRMNPIQPANLRQQLSQKLSVNASAEELVRPLDDLWEDHV